MQNRYRGALLGLACGDAVGTVAEFKPRGAFPPITDMTGGGPFRLKAGEWTDDTALALCLATSLVECGGFDPRDQMERYCRWRDEGYLSSNGRCFDIGRTTANALARYRATGNPYSGSTDPRAAGNGSIMRLAPVPMFYAADLAQVERYSAASSRTTHAAPEAVDACRLFGVMLALALRGETQPTVLNAGGFVFDPELAPAIRSIAAGAYRDKSSDEINSSGYVVESLEAALWCFYRTDNYREAVLLAANLGDDADTTAAVCGQIAGAYYGVESIPPEWLRKLALRDTIEKLADGLYAAAERIRQI